jgi:hypothetical protein
MKADIGNSIAKCTRGGLLIAVAAWLAGGLLPWRCAAEQVASRMFDLTYANAVEVANNFNRTWRGGLMGTNGNWSVCEIAVEGVQSLDLRDLEDRAAETKRE